MSSTGGSLSSGTKSVVVVVAGGLVVVVGTAVVDVVEGISVVAVVDVPGDGSVVVD